MVAYGEWLNDRHLQAICESRFCHNEVDEPRAYTFIVEQIQAALQDFAQPTSQGFVRRRHFCIANSEAGEGLHWFVVAWDGRMPRGDFGSLSPLERASWAVQNFAVRIVDSLDTDAYCAPLVQALRNLGIEPKVDILGTQGDGWRCGYFACWALERMLKTKARGFMTVRIPPMPWEYTTLLADLAEAGPDSAAPTAEPEEACSEPSTPLSATQETHQPEMECTPPAPSQPPSLNKLRSFADFPELEPFFAPRHRAWDEIGNIPIRRTVPNAHPSIPALDPWATRSLFAAAAPTMNASLFRPTHPLFYDLPQPKRFRSTASGWPFSQSDPFASFWF